MRRLRLYSSSVVIVLVTVFSWCFAVPAAEPLRSSSSKALLAIYPAIKKKLEKNQFGIPVYLESQEKPGSLQVDVYGIFEYPFDAVKDALQVPANWCEITPLHVNIKACTSRNVNGRWLLTLYSGRKYYQPPEDAYELNFRFHLLAQQPDYLDISITADEGPLYTKDHRIRLEAVPLDSSRTFIRFRYSYSYEMPARIAIKSYFSTIARDKVGFSITGSDDTANPVYIGGVRGSVERNAVRHYLALQSYLDTRKFPREQQFEKRLSRSFELTSKYPRQLYEMDIEEYLTGKRREHKNQLMLQQEIDK